MVSPASQSRNASSFFSSRRRHSRLQGDWSSDVCSSDVKINDVMARLVTVPVFADPALNVVETFVRVGFVVGEQRVQFPGEIFLPAERTTNIAGLFPR